ncbi:MAG TPA: hypothetical protein VMQ93_19870 [Novosphingobium sp.]|nr:hypothetical protein [Novosphingobium sp.]
MTTATRRIGRLYRLAPWGFVAAICASASAAAVRDDFRTNLPSSLALAQQAARRGDCPRVLDVLSPIVSDSEFPSLPEPTRGSVLMMTGVCEARDRRFDDAAVHIRAATALPSAAANLWITRFQVETYSSHPGDAVTTLEAMQRQASGALSELEPEAVRTLNRRLKNMPNETAARDRLLALASDPAFVPGRYDPAFEYMRLDNARRLATAGDRAGAQAQVDRLTSRNALIEASLDPALRFTMAADYDMRAATQREVEHLEGMSAQRPDLLALVNERAGALRVLGAPDKALALLQSARPDGASAHLFSDLGTKLNWWWDELSSAYAQLGRYDDALNAMKPGMKAGEYGEFNVSQLLNLASMQLRFGKPDEALATLVGKENGLDSNASPYGKMIYHRVHGCAAHRTGKADVAATDLAYLAAHRADQPSSLAAMQLCIGDIDAAAATMVARLDDPKMRGSALLDLSKFEDWPSNLPPDPDKTALAQLLARPDVTAAIGRAGGVRSFNILPRGL